MTQNEYKVGDRVRIEIPGLYDIGVIIAKDAYGYNVKCGEHHHFGVCGEYLELTSLDRKTAFLTRLQSLLKEFDARIYDNDYYRVYIDLGIHDSLNPMERIVYTDTEGEITADNIMDFDKE